MTVSAKKIDEMVDLYNKCQDLVRSQSAIAEKMPSPKATAGSMAVFIESVLNATVAVMRDAQIKANQLEDELNSQKQTSFTPPTFGHSESVVVTPPAEIELQCAALQGEVRALHAVLDRFIAR